jgi:hypothetical protein
MIIYILLYLIFYHFSLMFKYDVLFEKYIFLLALFSLDGFNACTQKNFHTRINAHMQLMS